MLYRTIVIFFSTIFFNLIKCDVYRLPTNIKPIRYTLTVETNLDPTLTKVPYNGSVIIDLDVTKNTKDIILHKKKLIIDEDGIEVLDANNNKIKVVQTSTDDDREIYTISLKNHLRKNQKYKLKIEFTNYLGVKNVGFYVAKYYDEKEQPRHIALTDFEPTDARLAFPCFDDPIMRSNFNINIIRKRGENSVSNAELEKTIDLGDGRFRDVFKETPKMPTYLVSWVISDYKESKTVERHRILGRPVYVNSNSFDYSLDISVKTLQALEEYTGIKFAFNKMTQVAVPDDYFKDEAMENWALVIYRESALLCTNQSDANYFKTCVTYIAHEFAHQWFGNLVSPSWWDYTWLSESFATYFQYYIGDIVQPSWRLMDQFIIDNIQKGFESDAKEISTPLNYHTKFNGDFPPLDILYAKGSSILRMAEHFLTPEVFKSGLRAYLQERQFDTAEPHHLYSALQDAVDSTGINNLGGSSVARILKTWASNKGYPIVTVTRNYNNGKITFEQDRFSSSGYLPLEKNWAIPVNYIFQSSSTKEYLTTTPSFWLTTKKLVVKLNHSTDDWLIVNKQQTGYYRVNYDNENWERIIAFMNSEDFHKVHVLNRAQLIDDAFNVASSKIIPYDIPLRLCNYIKQEKDYIPLQAFLNGVAKMRTEEVMIGSDKNKQYVLTSLEHVFKTVGFEDKPSDTMIDRLIRMDFVTWLCRFNHPDCIEYSLKKVQEMKQLNKSTVSPDLEVVIFCIGIRNATESEFDALLNIYKTTSDLFQKRRLAQALVCNPTFASQKLS